MPALKRYNGTLQQWELVSGGVAGSSGGGSSFVTYTHTQSVAASTWNIMHNLGRYPSVSVVDGSGNVIIADVRYVDNNNVTVTLGSNMTGLAYLN